MSEYVESSGGVLVPTVMNQSTTPARPSPVTVMRRNVSGQWVDEYTAMTYAAYFACIRVISEDLAGFPWHVHRRSSDGSREVVEGSRVGNLLHTRPNPETTAFNFRQMLAQNALGWGNGYAEIERDMSNRPIALWQLHPSRTWAERNREGELVYRYRNTVGDDTVLPARDVFHVMGPTDDGLTGLSIAALARNSIGLGIAAEQFGSSFFGNGAHPGGTLEYPGRLSPEARDNLRESWNQLHQGAESGMKAAILEEGLKYTPIGIPPEDAQFIETRQHQIEDVVRWFRVPPHKIQHLLRATFNNIEQLNLNYLSDALLPWILRFEQEANAKLLNQPGLFSKLDLRSLLRADSKTRSEFYTKLFQLGWSVNEIRALEDMDPIGPDGDARFVPVNVQTLERAIEPPEPPEDPDDDDVPELDSEGADDDEGGQDALEETLEAALDRGRRRIQHRSDRGEIGAAFWAQHVSYVRDQLREVTEAFGLDADPMAWAQVVVEMAQSGDHVTGDDLRGLI